MRAVRAPRAGHGLCATTAPDAVEGVAIVYSSAEEIRLKLKWEDWHKFDLAKGARIFEKLVADKAVRPEQVFVPAPADDQMLARVHSRRYIESLADRHVIARIMESDIALWQSPQDHVDRIVSAYRTRVGGTVLAAELAAAHGMAVHLGGGMKHAYPEDGARGCVLADVPVAVAAMRQRRLAQRFMIVDLGACQANGIAACLAGDKDVFLLDIYEKDNYPPAKQPEPDGVPINGGLGDGEYLDLLRRVLPAALDRFKPDFVIYLAGTDVSADDPAGQTALTAIGLLDRDRFVVEQVRQRKLPLCVLLGDGWAPDSWRLHYRSVRWMLARYGGVAFRPAQ